MFDNEINPNQKTSQKPLENFYFNNNKNRSHDK